VSQSVLYLDLETIPDEHRSHLYRTPPVGVLESDPLGPALAIQQTTGKAVDELLRNPRITLDWLTQAHVAEQGRFEVTGSPSRSTVLGKIAKRIASLGKEDKATAAGLVPEHGRIVAFGFGDHEETWSETEERAGLEEFWERVNGNVKIVGWNVLGFDLPFILARSAILGVKPTREFDRRPYETFGVCDLMLARFGTRGWRRCEDVAHEYGFGLRDDIDGSEVADVWATDPAAVVEHVEVDIDRVRHLHRCWNGLFVKSFEVPEGLEAGF